MSGFFSGLFAGSKKGQAKPTTPGPGSPDEGNGTGRGRRRKNETEFTSYYGRPVIKKPHWVWPIWFYFWTGGIAGGASAIVTLAELFGDPERDRSIVRAGRYISLAGLIASPVLLIIDLQRPERFYHMLRVLKLRSPLSVGTWILTSTGLLSGVNTARQLVEDDVLPLPGWFGQLTRLASNRLTSTAQGLEGLALGSYTGVLLTATAVPLWAETDLELPPIFLASAFSSGAAAISLARAIGGVRIEELHRLDQIEQGAILTELSLLAVSAYRLPPQVRRHATQGRYGKLFAAAIGLGQLGPFLLQLVGPRKGKLVRPLQILTSLMVLTGSLLLRIAVVEAGKASADDPDAYHAATRGAGRPSPQEQAARAANRPEERNNR